MAASIESKKVVVEQIKSKFADATSFILVDYRGLTVSEATELRNKYREAGVEFKVLKNTLITRAIEGLGYDDLAQYLQGPTAVAFSFDDVVAPAKVTYDFIKAMKKMEIKGGVVDGSILGKAQVEQLGQLPPRDVLIAKALGSMMAPIASFARVIDAIRVQKEQA